MTTLAFVDTETTGLDPARHEVWEVGLILRSEDGIETEHVWQLPVDLGRADARALTIGRYYDRAEPWFPKGLKRRPDEVTQEFARLTHGAHLVGAVPSFDDAFLKRLLRANGECPGWHYHLIDVEALAAGRLATLGDSSPDAASLAQPPWNSTLLSGAVGVNPDDFDRHTALGDARWAKAIYDAVMGR